jgi:hypothetical protein
MLIEYIILVVTINKELKMPKFKVAVSWEMYGVVEVEAESVEDAILIVNMDNDIPLPDGDYVDDSFQANEDVTIEMNDMKLKG